MKKSFYFLTLVILISFILPSCSSSEETIKKEEENIEEEVYVFDEVPPDTSADIEEPEYKIPSDNVSDVEEPERSVPSISKTYYKVQIGAFTTKEKAEEFVSGNRVKLQEDLDVTYNEEVHLYVVQLSSSFISKEEAEEVRNQLWQMEEYKDAWIVTINK
jgi:cell division protein FtsN